MKVCCLLNKIALAKESLLLSLVDWFAVKKVTEYFNSVYDSITAVQLKKLTAGEFFGQLLKCKVQLQRKSMNNASFLVLIILHAVECRKANLLFNAAFLLAIYVDQGSLSETALLKYSQKKVAHTYLAAL